LYQDLPAQLQKYYEQRWFTSAAQRLKRPYAFAERWFPWALTCFSKPATPLWHENLRGHVGYRSASSHLALQGAEIIFNPSASNECIGKHAYRCSLISQQSARCLAGYVYAACGFGESSTDVVFGGNGLIYENGSLLAASERFALGEQLTVSEIDVQRLRTERRMNTTFAANRAIWASERLRAFKPD
jgi:NAD+ synthase (glutamine-hydrolysing)